MRSPELCFGRHVSGVEVAPLGRGRIPPEQVLVEFPSQRRRRPVAVQPEPTIFIDDHRVLARLPPQRAGIAPHARKAAYWIGKMIRVLLGRVAGIDGRATAPPTGRNAASLFAGAGREVLLERRRGGARVPRVELTIASCTGGASQSNGREGSHEHASVASGASAISAAMHSRARTSLLLRRVRTHGPESRRCAPRSFRDRRLDDEQQQREQRPGVLLGEDRLDLLREPPRASSSAGRARRCRSPSPLLRPDDLAAGRLRHLR